MCLRSRSSYLPSGCVRLCTTSCDVAFRRRLFLRLASRHLFPDVSPCLPFVLSRLVPVGNGDQHVGNARDTHRAPARCSCAASRKKEVLVLLPRPHRRGCVDCRGYSRPASGACLAAAAGLEYPDVSVTSASTRDDAGAVVHRVASASPLDVALASSSAASFRTEQIKLPFR